MKNLSDCPRRTMYDTFYRFSWVSRKFIWKRHTTNCFFFDYQQVFLFKFQLFVKRGKSLFPCASYSRNINTQKKVRKLFLRVVLRDEQNYGMNVQEKSEWRKCKIEKFEVFTIWYIAIKFSLIKIHIYTDIIFFRYIERPREMWECFYPL